MNYDWINYKSLGLYQNNLHKHLYHVVNKHLRASAYI